MYEFDSSDDAIGNPLVSEFQDEFQPDDQNNSKPHTYYKTSNSDVKSLLPYKPPTSNGSSEVEYEKTVPDDCDMKQTNDEFDSTINSEISEITSEAFDTWMGTDSKWRRSPEGGEDVSAVSHTLDYSGSTVYDDSTSVTSSNVHMELLSSKHSRSSANISMNSDSDGNNLQNRKERKKKERDRERDREKVHFSCTKEN